MLRQQLLNNLGFPVPKNRKPKFDLTLRIIDLNNIPLVYGKASVKWHLPSSNTAEHRGRTHKVSINDHTATWNYEKEISVRLTIDKLQTLQDCEIHFEVLQEYFDGGRGARVVLGAVKLNLAEYSQLPEALADTSGDKDEDEGGITRRYLMQDSKVNATLKIGIRMKQTEGDSNFIAPALKSAMVIGGIAGIMNAEAGEADDMPNITSKTRELSEAQDVYRRTLVSKWSCQGGELPPDRLIEDLFIGGDGGKMEPPPVQHHHRFGHSPRVDSKRNSIDSSYSDADSRRTVTPNHLSPDTAKTGHRRGHSSHGHEQSASHAAMVSGVSGRGSIDQQLQLVQSGRRKGQHEIRETTEFDLREDLRSWQIRAR